VRDCIVIIPTYNEKENIERIIRTVFSFEKEFDILIIDDGSPDGTADIVRGLQKEFIDRLHMIERKGKLGLGTAYIAGFHYALEKSYEYIFEMDADFSHPPHDLINLYTACKNGADVAVGSRYIKGISVVNWPLGRIMMSYYASVYVRTVLRMKIKDSTAGFVCYRRDVLKNIHIDDIRMKGYGFQIEMKFRSWRMGYKIEEVPIIFTDRKEGNSKMSGGIFSEAFWGVLKLRFNSRKIIQKAKANNLLKTS
jgi:dolichol-phosphate mannosyltransferase